jgi:hypothetical protein
LEFVFGTTRVVVVEDLLQHRQQILGLLQENLMVAQDRMKMQANKHRMDRQFVVGDWVFLRLQLFKQKTMHKKLGYFVLSFMHLTRY